ncbi:MAG: bifunctional 5,10-methylenetetrahydrofolate dehydrogenase/5,10-methenyltetrahydrofolate cyclohydrolase [Ignavibacteriales bacterium]|nr:bifunctional 5,10-methylenetetrahydrofolate dehydrogenase/5,10-methenyltetrahydrofolate cyclohydrolase [Ignavibacteriales bacterium]
MQLLEGKIVAAHIRQEIKTEIARLLAEGKQAPGLVVILVGEDPGSQSYVKSKEKACIELGMLSTVIRLPETAGQAELLALVEQFNNDTNYHGILVQLPLPKHIDEYKVIETINPLKDVDGFHPVSAGRLLLGMDTFIPCTPAGIIELIKYYNIETKGKHAVVVGRSNIVGKPIATLLARKDKHANCITTLCHTGTNDIAYYTRQADIIIAAIGKAGIITADMVKDGCTVIDVGINRVEDATAAKGYRITGDVAFDEVAPKCAYITPVPGGVGLMTIAMLMKNTLQAYKKWMNV